MECADGAPAKTGTPNRQRFMVPRDAPWRKVALHKPGSSGRESAHLSLGKFEPTDVGCYEGETVHGPDACAYAKGGFPSTDVGSEFRLWAAGPARTG